MNLPIILDIAIGLVFIYLIASLLASELQELLSSLLQWRAKHLKESIQNLLSGGQGTDKDDKLRDFLEQIYSDPLLKNMNQSARGLIGHLGHLFYQYIVVPIFYGGKNIFGQSQSAPSYISPDTFATTLLEQIGLNTLVNKLTEIRLEKFMGRLIGLYDVAEVQSGREISIPAADFFQDKDYRERGNIRVLSDKAKTLVPTGETSEWVSKLLTLDDQNPEFKALVEEYDDILRDFNVGEADLETCVERMKEGLDIYISQIAALLANDRPTSPPSQTSPTTASLDQEFGGENTLIDEQPSGELQSMDVAIAHEHHPLSPTEKQQLGYFKRRLVALRTGTFGEATERAIASGRLRPSLLEIAEVFDRTSMTYQEIEGAYQTIAAVYETEHIARQARKVVDALNTHITALQKTKGSDQQALIATLPTRPLNIADLADPAYQTPLSKILPHLKPEIRQLYQNWEQYQVSFAQIIQAIAAQLTAIGRLTDETTASPEMTGEMLSESAIATRSPQPDLNTLRIRINQTLSELSSAELDSLNQAIVAQLNPSDQKIYQGWQIFQRVILRVIRDIAQQLQGEGRFFDYHTRQEYAADLSTFDEIDLYQCVRYSLKLMSNEERQLRINAAVRSLNTDERKLFSNYQIYEQIQDILGTVPVSVKQSLAILARRAQTRVGKTQNQLDQFNFEVSCWFDRSMGRASGVYKRNAKGVAIIIGILIAVISNIDTFHVVGRLSRDEDLRQVLITRASTVTENSAPSTTLSERADLRKLREDALAGLETTAMPLGWNPENWAQQLNCEVNAKDKDGKTKAVTWQMVYETCLHERPAPDQFDLWRLSQLIVQDGWKSVWSFLKVLLGWLISGVAIAMGAPFWFDLLSKFMNVRSTGTKPASVVDSNSAKPSS